jgi:hypothetical protein
VLCLRDRGSAAPGSADDEPTDDADAAGDPGAAKSSAPAAERRRAASVLVGLWRELARDLLVVALGEERQVRDPALLDDLRDAAANLDPAATNGSSPKPDPGHAARARRGAALGTFLGRLDLAGELLEANVRPELVLDTLLLHWPRAAAP